MGQDLEQDALRTYEEWVDWGYVPMKGSKHVSRNFSGKPLFHPSQVVEIGQDSEMGEHFLDDDWGDRD